MERPTCIAAALAALAQPTASQIHLVQTTPAEIGTSMQLEVTDATPGATIVLLGSVTLGSMPPALGSPPPALGMTKPLPGGPGLFHATLGTTNAFGTLTASVALPPSTGLLGRVLPMRAVDLGAFSETDALSNKLAAWIGPHPVTISPTPETSGQFGRSVAIGDFVGTSALDVAVGALETVAGALAAGRVHVYAGPGFTSVVTLTSPAPSSGGHFGWSLAALDWNGDGATDLAVGEPGKDGLFPFTDIGAVHVFAHPVGSGGSSTFTDPTPVTYEQMGYSLAAGAIDASPSDELVAGASFHGISEISDAPGSILVLAYSGGPATITEVSEPTPEGGGFGDCVALGDTDGDGYDEILVGEPDHDEPGASDCGAVHLFDGGALVLSLLDDAPIMGDRLGTSVAIGDLNGDELGDMLVGVFGENQAQLYTAPAFSAASPKLLTRAHPADTHGGRAVAVADVNGDGKLDALVAFGNCEVPGFGVVCGSVTAYLGKNLKATAYVADLEILPWSLATGDVDGDGRDEIALGSPGASPPFLPSAGAFLLSK